MKTTTDRKRKQRSWRLVAAAAAAVALCACQSAPEEPDPVWRDAEVSSPSDRVLFKICLLAMQKLDFPLAGTTDPSSMVAVSGWRSSLQPFKGKGHRERAEIRLDPLGKGRWRVAVRVARQRNVALVRQLDARYAEWEWQSDDVETARILLQHVRAMLLPEIEITEPPEDPVEALIERGEEDP